MTSDLLSAHDRLIKQPRCPFSFTQDLCLRERNALRLRSWQTCHILVLRLAIDAQAFASVVKQTEAECNQHASMNRNAIEAARNQAKITRNSDSGKKTE